MQERIRHPEHRAHLARLVALGRPLACPDETEADRELRRDGVTHFPGYLAPAGATSLRNLLETFECEDPWKPERGAFMVEDAPPNTHVADIPAAPTLRALHDIAFDPSLLRMAARYFGSRPYVDSVQAWWSLSGNTEPEEAENFHRDNDSIRFLKFFLYLTDVGDDDGPHRFVSGSHVEPRVLDRRRLTDAEVEEAFGAERMLTMRGRPGDAFMEDTFGVHKGQLPKAGKRLLVQVRYSIMPSVFCSRTLIDRPAPVAACGADSLLHLRRRRG
ncbi:hypothetical protein GCM10009116_03760 [Brevundimonas basaltis]|uniref:Phytanoyl-CoA dioxygenase (PhyH) n=1 Tax=Brevundimonas basaltis TaxID=472166 RepID=A0A7W8HZ83_9CAUL|nr:phytanoyl-CoA dioxygenase family protein [Brevundimonas basaltis]MBB5292646.1 hypothetical protein [Brevundimonas basaltis]